MAAVLHKVLGASSIVGMSILGTVDYLLGGEVIVHAFVLALVAIAANGAVMGAILHVRDRNRRRLYADFAALKATVDQMAKQLDQIAGLIADAATVYELGRASGSDITPTVRRIR